MKLKFSSGLLMAATTVAFSQNPTEPAAALDEIVVTSDPLDRSYAKPVTVLLGADLQRKLEPTLGETLNNEPGVSSTYFGPGASRPVIRGLGDDRVRVLQNGTAVMDVSNVSPDHAVATDPLAIRSVEVVRGPATLLYGPNSMGGVVNVTDDRIPENAFLGEIPAGKFGFTAGSADDLLSESGSLSWGTGPLVFHLDGFHRETDDLKIPGHARSKRQRKSDPPGTPDPTGILPNSATNSTGAGLGGSYIWNGGFLGFSYSGVDSNYGTVADPDVTIDLSQRRWDMRGGVHGPTAAIKEIAFKLGYSDYEHTEWEGSEVGTVFHIEGYNGRVDLSHEPLGPLEGTIGFETLRNKFSALGEEAFLPEVTNHVHSIFVFEEVPVGEVRLQLGARYDRQTNETTSDVRFGPGISKHFDAFSTSAGVVYEPLEDFEIALAVAYTQRPPTYVELFADGPHVATGSYEIGDQSLGTEDAVSLDLSVRKTAGRVTGSAGVFYYRFNDFISAQATGVVDPVDGLPIYAYRPIGADFYGGEFEAKYHVFEASTAQRLDFILRADCVHAENRGTNEPIPRIPPVRTSLAVDYRNSSFGARLEGQYAARQGRNAEYELPTDSYFLANASLSYETAVAGVATTFFVKCVNLTNEEARQSTSFLKDAAPLAGRGVVVGVRSEF